MCHYFKLVIVSSIIISDCSSPFVVEIVTDNDEDNPGTANAARSRGISSLFLTY